ncbi:DUF4336 domain-containing protein [Moritella sp. 36]|uniref:DUF4336 domain-containing protein n=1 Tax=Moritella sp. 36 TaxID=2746233 RepID=UPI001BA6C0BB|nr:DUF4336 domain-containing protein [Moritella sp. 36]QUM89756.1 DUF4336 domain-containing protein [Moritella sp. 36]
MQKIADNIWIFDGEPVSFLACPFTTRMTVVRLFSGDLWIHSPIKLTTELQQTIQSIGSVKYIVAPNHLHHLFIADWHNAFPKSSLFGTSEVIKKRQDIAFHFSLNDEHDWPWKPEITQELVLGSKLMQEAVFFHKSSKVLILTDFIENFPKSNFNWWQCILASIAGIIAPNGKTPLDWRISFNKRRLREHLIKIKSWNPEIIVMAHGDIVDVNGGDFLEKSFSWLD